MKTDRLRAGVGISLFVLIAAFHIGEAAELPEITAQIIGTQSTTSFPKLLYVQVTNPGYTPLNLAQMLANSTLFIDGKPSQRVAGATFRGPQGLPPMGEWSGCLALDSFSPPIAPGRHKLHLKIGDVQTDEIKVSWEPPLNWRQGDLKSRLKEIKQLGLALEDGLPQSCVEQWLTLKDGGQPEEDQVRYFLEPQFKMSVPYRQMYEPSGMHAVVDGPPKIYKEQRLTD